MFVINENDKPKTMQFDEKLDKNTQLLRKYQQGLINFSDLTESEKKFILENTKNKGNK